MINLHLFTKLRDLACDSHIYILIGKVLLHSDVWELVYLNRLVTLILLRNHVDNNVSICDDLSHGIDVTGAIIHKAGMSEIKHRFDITVLRLVTAISDIGVCTIFS